MQTRRSDGGIYAESHGRKPYLPIELVGSELLHTDPIHF